MPGFIEKRKSIRYSCDRSVELDVRGRIYNGYVTNIRSGSAFIEVRGTFTIGDLVSMTFQPGVSISGAEKKTGKIVQLTSKEIGMEFKKPGYAE